MEKLNEKIKRLRKEHGYNQTKVAEKIGVSQNAYSRYELGLSEPKYFVLSELAKLYGMTVESILDNEPIQKVGFKIPVLGTIPAGIPIEAVEEILDYEEIPQEWTTQGEYFGLKVKGNSMEPRIMNGDVVICRKQESADSGDVCVIMVNGNDATLKQIKKDANGISLVPFNQNYSPMFYSNEQIATLPVRIIGKVVELRGKF